MFQGRFLCDQTKRGDRTFPAETSASTATNTDVPHRSRSREELKPRGALHSHGVAYCDFTIVERERRASQVVETKRTCTAAGVRYIPMTVLSRGEVPSDGTSAFTQRQKDRQKETSVQVQTPPPVTVSSNQPIRMKHLSVPVTSFNMISCKTPFLLSFK